MNSRTRKHTALVAKYDRLAKEATTYASRIILCDMNNVAYSNAHNEKLIAEMEAVVESYNEIFNDDNWGFFQPLLASENDVVKTTHLYLACKVALRNYGEYCYRETVNALSLKCLSENKVW